jgi:hypothetical protein
MKRCSLVGLVGVARWFSFFWEIPTIFITFVAGKILSSECLKKVLKI